MERELYKKTLALVNKILISRGKKPMKKLSAGIAQNGRQCPITQTLLDGSFAKDGTEVFTTRTYVRLDDDTVTDGDDQRVIEKFTREVDEYGRNINKKKGIDLSSGILVDPNKLLKPVSKTRKKK